MPEIADFQGDNEFFVPRVDDHVGSTLRDRLKSDPNRGEVHLRSMGAENGALGASVKARVNDLLDQAGIPDGPERTAEKNRMYLAAAFVYEALKLQSFINNRAGIEDDEHEVVTDADVVAFLSQQSLGEIAVQQSDS